MSIINPVSKNILTFPDVSDTLVSNQIIVPLQTNILTANSILSVNGINNSTNIATNINTINTSLSTVNNLLTTNGINNSSNIITNINTINSSLTDTNTKITELQSQINNLPNTGVGSGTNYFLSNVSNNGFLTISKTSPNGNNVILSSTIKDISGNVLIG